MGIHSSIPIVEASVVALRLDVCPDVARPTLPTAVVHPPDGRRLIVLVEEARRPVAASEQPLECQYPGQEEGDLAHEEGFHHQEAQTSQHDRDQGE